MSDLVKRLRAMCGNDPNTIVTQAADEIERLLDKVDWLEHGIAEWRSEASSLMDRLKIARQALEPSPGIICEGVVPTSESVRPFVDVVDQSAIRQYANIVSPRESQ